MAVASARVKRTRCRTARGARGQPLERGGFAVHAQQVVQRPDADLDDVVLDLAPVGLVPTGEPALANTCSPPAPRAAGKSVGDALPAPPTRQTPGATVATPFPTRWTLIAHTRSITSS